MALRKIDSFIIKIISTKGYSTNMEDHVYRRTDEIMSGFSNSDPGHQMDHIDAVLNHLNQALKCNTTFDLTEEQIRALRYAVMMHDVDDHKLTDTHDTLANAYGVLAEVGEDHNNTELVLQMIRLVSCSSNGNNNSMCVEHKNWWLLWPRIVDRLEAIGNIGIWRAWVYAVKKGNPMHTLSTPLPKTEEELKEIISAERFARYSGSSDSLIDHFYDKLLYIANLDSPEVQSNAYLLQIAKERHQIMVDFVLDYSNSEDKDKIIKEYIGHLIK